MIKSSMEIWLDDTIQEKYNRLVTEKKALCHDLDLNTTAIRNYEAADCPKAVAQCRSKIDWAKKEIDKRERKTYKICVTYQQGLINVL